MGEKINNVLKGEIISSVFYILLGLCLILIPTQTVDVICKVVFGLILIGVGIYHIYIYIRGKATATIMDLLSGVVVFVLGVFLFMTPSIVIKLLPWMLSAFVLVDSLWKFKGAFLLKKGGHGAWSVLLIGSLVFIALGIVMLFGRFPKIMTLLIFSGWVLVCDGAADIVFYIIMKLGLRKIAKKAETEKEDSGADSSDAVNETADMDVPNDTRTQDENAPSEQQSGKETEYPTETTAETTAAMLAFGKENVYSCNLGDSRIYQISSEGKLGQLSLDHVLGGGRFGKPPLTQYLGIPEESMGLEPTIVPQKAEIGTRYLICSDGITDMLSDGEIADILTREISVSETVELLVERALIKGGRDNITVILCELVEQEKSLFGKLLNYFL